MFFENVIPPLIVYSSSNLSLVSIFSIFFLYSSIEHITFAGTPHATELSEIFLLTTEPAPIILFSPIVTPGRIVTLAPIKTLFSILMRPILVYPNIF